MNLVEETVRVIRGGQAGSYVVAEEHDDGSLLLRPGTSDMPVSEREPEHAVATKSQATTASSRQPSVILDVRELSVSYGTKKAVDDVRLQITRGEIFGLLGPNGAGKTSTLSAIEGLIKPKSGTVLLDGIDIRRHPAQAKAKMGVQLQATSFQSELTIKQIVKVVRGPLRHQAV